LNIQTIGSTLCYLRSSARNTTQMYRKIPNLERFSPQSARRIRCSVTIERGVFYHILHRASLLTLRFSSSGVHTTGSSPRRLIPPATDHTHLIPAQAQLTTRNGRNDVDLEQHMHGEVPEQDIGRRVNTLVEHPILIPIQKVPVVPAATMILHPTTLQQRMTLGSQTD
jgi:hypothetical protein